MLASPTTIHIDLRTDDNGIIRIGTTRITLETFVAAYKRGDTPEEIVEGFPALALADVYALIAYYLQQQKDVDDYIERQRHNAQALRHEIATHHPEMQVGQAKFRAALEKHHDKESK